MTAWTYKSEQFCYVIGGPQGQVFSMTGRKQVEEIVSLLNHMSDLEVYVKELEEELDDSNEAIEDLNDDLASAEKSYNYRLTALKNKVECFVEDVEKGQDYSRSLYDLKDHMTYGED